MPTGNSSDGIQWLWTGTTSGLFSTVALADSPVVLTLNSGNEYNVSLNGQESLQGTYSIDSSAGWSEIEFGNINEPAGTKTIVTSGNVTYLFFNYSQIGRLTLYQNNSMSISGDTLTMLRYPITPETPVSTYVRIATFH